MFKPEHLREIIAAAERGYPNEACGLIVGTDPATAQHFEMENLYDRYHAVDPVSFPRSARNAYKMNDLKRARLVEEAGGLLCIWHSHPDVGAYFSEEDTAAALGEGHEPLFPGTAYLVVSCRQGKVDDLKVFRWNKERRAFEGEDVALH